VSLSCDCDYGDPAAWYRVEDRKARKQWECEECGLIIRPGDAYRFETGMWGGLVSQHRCCESCADLSDSLRDLGFCLYWGNLNEDYQEYLHEYKTHYDEAADAYLLDNGKSPDDYDLRDRARRMEATKGSE